MSDSIAIVCTVNELADHATCNARLFAANISAGATVGPTLPLSTVTQNLLSPWLWMLDMKAGPMQLYVQRGGTAGPAAEAQGLTPFPVTSTDPAYTLLTARMQLELQNAVSLTEQLAASSNPANLLLWDPSDPGAGSGSQENAGGAVIQPWPQFLSHASTYPAPLPHLLNLVVFFKVDAATLNTGDILFAAPVFSVGGVPYKPAAGANPTPVLPKAGGMTGDVTPGYSWTYMAASGSNLFPDLAVYQNGLTVAAPYVAQAPASGAPRIDLQSMWIAASLEDGNDDWRSTLEQRAADSFDLAQKVIDAFRGNSGSAYVTAPTPDSLEQLRITVLSLLRDTADFGLRLAPDGYSTFRYVVDRAARANGVPYDFAANLKLLVAKDGDMTLSSWQSSLLQFLMQSSTATGDAWSLALVDVHTWNTLTPQPQPQTLARLLDALDALQTKLADDATLGQWLQYNWQNVLAWTPTVAGTIGAYVQTELNELSTSHTLRKRMLQANLGGASSALAIWKSLTNISTASTDKERTQMNGNISRVLLAYYHTRVGDAPVSDATLAGDFANRMPRLAPVSPATTLPLPQDMITFLAQAISNLATSAANDLFPLDGTSPAGQPVPVVQTAGKDHPVLLQVHTTAPLAAASDPLRGIAGVCILAREDAAGTQWSCLNASSLAVVDPGDLSKPKIVANGYFVPQRLTLRNGLLQAAISYNNEPLIAPSPKSAVGTNLQQSVKNTNSAAYTPLFKYLYQPDPSNFTNPDTLDAWAYIAGLKYGCKYQFAAFAVHNSGALPIDLTDPSIPGYPLVPRTPKSFTLPTAATVVPVTYNRRIAVGGPRWQPNWASLGADQNGDLSQQALPIIPDTVNPFARELDPTLTKDTNGKTLPLLLLWPHQAAVSKPELDPSTFSFAIRPPSIHLDSWDRWIRPAGPANSAPNPLDNLRKAVYADVFSASPKGSAADLPGSVAAKTALSAPAQDTSLNDRAVIALQLRLDTVPASATPTAVQCLVDLAATYSDVGATPGFNSGFKQVQANIIPVKVVTDASGPKIVGDVSGITIKIPPGTVWKLSIASAVDQAVIDPVLNPKTARFDNITAGPLFDTSNAGTTPAGNKVVPVVNPLQMLIEVAKSANIIAQDVWNAFNPAFSGNTLSVSLTAPAGGDWSLVRRVDVTRQAWRWLGRPYNTKGFPSAAAPLPNTINFDSTKSIQYPDPNMSIALQWEAEAFAGRVDGDSTVSTSKVHFPQGVTSPTTVTVYSSDLSSDLRALYFRFAIRIYSRYDGLPDFSPFTTGASVTSRIALTDTQGSADGFTVWKRIFVPARVAPNAKMAKPKVLLCIPLTTALDPQGYPILSGSASAPSVSRTDLLVIADEPWHQTAGLAEQLIASIESTTNPDRTTRPQIGPDPILSGAALDQALAATFQAANGTSAQSIGTAMGATFDEVTDAPLFANTCFHVRLPQIQDTAGKFNQSLDWVMAKLQFSRAIDTGMYDPTLGTAPQSPLTDGTWVQLLPSSDHFNSSAGPVAVTDLVFQTDTVVSLRKRASPATVVSLQPSVASSNQLEVWALLMQSIVDAAGLPAEVYTGLICLSGTSVNLTATSPTLANADHLYLLEVQKTVEAPLPTATNPPDWLERLFPSSDPSAPTNAAYRVVRLSGRISRFVAS